MATRKKTSLSPISGWRRVRNKLTSRTACFVWGAIFGNAVLSQPINPLNLLLHPPEYMLSEASRQWLHSTRDAVRQFTGSISSSFTDAALNKAREHLPALPRPTPPPAVAPAAPSSSAAQGSFAACAEQFPSQQPLQVTAISAQWAPLALCSDAFAVLYSGLTKTPMVVVERLNSQRLQQAAGLARTDQFYADTRVSRTQRAELADYQGSGYDRGHLAAAANQPTPQAMAQSFALSNMVPQDPTHNRKLWAKLEADVRKYAQRAAGNVFVFSGTLHGNSPKTMGSNQVWVPDQLFKLVYDEAGQRAWAYVLPNQADAQITTPMDYASFVQRTQWRLLAGLPVTGSIR